MDVNNLQIWAEALIGNMDLITPALRVGCITLLLSLRIPPQWDEAIHKLFISNNFEIASLEDSLAMTILTCVTLP